MRAERWPHSVDKFHWAGALSREDGPALMEALNIIKALGNLVDGKLAWEKGCRLKDGERPIKIIFAFLIIFLNISSK